MKRALAKYSNELYHIKYMQFDRKNSIGYYQPPPELYKVFGAHSNIRGDPSNIWGDCTNISGIISENLSGDVSNISGRISNKLIGDITGITGNVTNITGNLDDCEITERDRQNGINIEDLVF